MEELFVDQLSTVSELQEFGIAKVYSIAMVTKLRVARPVAIL